MWLVSSLKQYEIWARAHDVPVSSAATRSVLQSLVALLRPAYCIEIWTAVGLGTVALAQQIAERYGSIVSFEISFPSYHKARLFVQSCHLSNVCLYHIDVVEAPLEKLITQPVDFVFVDGMKSLYTQYFDQWLSLTHSETVFVFDDVGDYHDKIGDLRAHCKDHGWQTHTVATEPWDAVLVARQVQNTASKEISRSLLRLQDAQL